MQYRRIVVDRKVCAVAALFLVWSLGLCAWYLHAAQ